MGVRMRRRRRSVAHPGWMMMNMVVVVVIMMIMNRKMTVMIISVIMTKSGDENERSTPIIIIIAPPALKTVIGIWRACFASGRILKKYCRFCQYDCVFYKPTIMLYVRELLAFCFVFVIRRQHFCGLLKEVSVCSLTLAIPSNAPSICLFIPSTRCFLASLQFCIFLKP